MFFFPFHFFFLCAREKDKVREREEAWSRIDELARKNPDVCNPKNSISQL